MNENQMKGDIKPAGKRKNKVPESVFMMIIYGWHYILYKSMLTGI